MRRGPVVSFIALDKPKLPLTPEHVKEHNEIKDKIRRMSKIPRMSHDVHQMSRHGQIHGSPGNYRGFGSRFSFHDSHRDFNLNKRHSPIHYNRRDHREHFLRGLRMRSSYPNHNEDDRNIQFATVVNSPNHDHHTHKSASPKTKTTNDEYDTNFWSTDEESSNNDSDVNDEDEPDILNTTHTDNDDIKVTIIEDSDDDNEYENRQYQHVNYEYEANDNGAEEINWSDDE